MAYTGLWRVLVKQGKIEEALFAAEKGRAQALTDLIKSNIFAGTIQFKEDGEDLEVSKSFPSNAVFQAVDKTVIYFWVLSKGKQVQYKQSKLHHTFLQNDSSQPFESFVLDAYTQLGLRFNVKCENRSLDALRNSCLGVDKISEKESSQPPVQPDDCLSTFYNIVTQPVTELVQGDELLIIPDGPQNTCLNRFESDLFHR